MSAQDGMLHRVHVLLVQYKTRWAITSLLWFPFTAQECLHTPIVIVLIIKESAHCKMSAYQLHFTQRKKQQVSCLLLQQQRYNLTPKIQLLSSKAYKLFSRPSPSRTCLTISKALFQDVTCYFQGPPLLGCALLFPRPSSSRMCLAISKAIIQDMPCYFKGPPLLGHALLFQRPSSRTCLAISKALPFQDVPCCFQGPLLLGRALLFPRPSPSRTCLAISKALPFQDMPCYFQGPPLLVHALLFPRPSSRMCLAISKALHFQYMPCYFQGPPLPGHALLFPSILMTDGVTPYNASFGCFRQKMGCYIPFYYHKWGILLYFCRMGQ